MDTLVWCKCVVKQAHLKHSSGYMVCDYCGGLIKEEEEKGKKILREIDYQIYYNKKDKMVVGVSDKTVSAIFVADLDRTLPLIENAPKGVAVHKAKLIIYKNE